ncbi:MAG: tRNA uridine-5-carboxymethylaminomethyl(34) synthesis GTPase MnmE [Bacteroidetes bacterium]|nr:tRNA uridine-5-carboxymethylaminomethyl(34) synthesis GTPase MnmE [Bacteroidota bacterium]
MTREDIICALATPPGTGAISIVRLSGRNCLALLDKVFKPSVRGSILKDAEGYTIHHGKIIDGEVILDDVLISVFRAPHSYTGEEAAEIGIHGSPFIQQRIIELMISLGARQAERGEFTMRAFLHGKYDLSQAEAVADLIASTTRTSHHLALEQMRGGFSQKIKSLRQQLVDFAALLELELDFSEEDVVFADRGKLYSLLEQLTREVTELLQSFTLGNVLKHGIPVAITGKPNVGKSTLLNAIINEERAIVSEIPGTTRDYIEDVIVLQGTAFRFIDTAGLRSTSDAVETMGIEKTREKISQARIILYVFDITALEPEELKVELDELRTELNKPDVLIIPIANKTDMLVESPHHFSDLVEWGTIFISAKRKENINLILESLMKTVQTGMQTDQVILSNTRHYQALQYSLFALEAVEKGFHEKISTDLIAIELRQALHHLGTITGEIAPDEVLGSVFGRFCIGK